MLTEGEGRGQCLFRGQTMLDPNANCRPLISEKILKTHKRNVHIKFSTIVLAICYIMHFLGLPVKYDYGK